MSIRNVTISFVIIFLAEILFSAIPSHAQVIEKQTTDTLRAVSDSIIRRSQEQVDSLTQTDKAVITPEDSTRKVKQKK